VGFLRKRQKRKWRGRKYEGRQEYEADNESKGAKILLDIWGILFGSGSDDYGGHNL